MKKEWDEQEEALEETQTCGQPTASKKLKKKLFATILASNAKVTVHMEMMLHEGVQQLCPF